jgi:hypothetical protein
MAENDGQQADIALRAGLETAHQAQEQTIDAILPYTVGEGTPEEEAVREVNTAVAAAATTEAATATFIAERRWLHEAHREARAIVDRWRETLAYAKERRSANGGSSNRGSQVAGPQERPPMRTTP